MLLQGNRGIVANPFAQQPPCKAGAARRPTPNSADDHGLEPGDEFALVGGGCLGEQDLEAALIGVLRVLRRGGVAAGGRQDLGAMAREQRERRVVDHAPSGPSLALSHQHDVERDPAPTHPRAQGPGSQKCGVFGGDRRGDVDRPPATACSPGMAGYWAGDVGGERRGPAHGLCTGDGPGGRGDLGVRD